MRPPGRLPGRRGLGTAVLWTAAAPGLLRAAERTIADPAAAEFFEKKIRPILVANCHDCHSTRAEKLKGKLLLDSRAGLLKGGETGLVIVPGRPDKSPLIEAVRYKNVELRMPPTGK